MNIQVFFYLSCYFKFDWLLFLLLALMPMLMPIFILFVQEKQ